MARGVAGEISGLIFDVDTFAVHDGPGVRMAVYLKGCPLTCRWCHSPESQRFDPELIFIKDRCAMCGGCAVQCSRSVHRVDGDGHAIDRGRCTACGQCVSQCPTGALAIKGHRATASSIVERAMRLKPFFDHSGGGITLTGGEVTAQAEFAVAVLAACQSLGIHTAVETCGACSWQRLEEIAAHADLILYDIKLLDTDHHLRWTGARNEQVLANACRLASRAQDVVVRVPLIPGITDSTDNLQGIFTFMQDAGLTHVELLPFNPSAAAKYEWLGLSYAIQGEGQAQQRLAELATMARSKGLVTIA